MKKLNIKYLLKEVLITLLIVIVVSNAISFYRAPKQDNIMLPNIQKLSIQGEPISSDLNNNKPTIVHVWALWCPICKTEAPNIQVLSKDYNVITIAVESGDDQILKEYMHNNNFTFSVINDKNGSLSSEFNVTVFPTTFIYDKNKQLTFTEVGYTSTLGLYVRAWWASI